MYEFRIARRLPSACFEPRPHVDAALLSVERRPQPLVAESEYVSYRALVQRGFFDGRRLREALGLPSLRFKRLAAELGFDRRAHARDLDLYQWVELHRAVRGLG